MRFFIENEYFKCVWDIIIQKQIIYTNSTYNIYKSQQYKFKKVSLIKMNFQYLSRADHNALLKIQTQWIIILMSNLLKSKKK